MPIEIILKSLVAGILASFACGLGALPLLFRKIDVERQRGLGYALAGGLMFAASVYNLILPGLTISEWSLTLAKVVPVLSGILLGAAFLWVANAYLSPSRLEQDSWKRWGGRGEILIFLVMAIHSIPEGVAVGVGYASEQVYSQNIGSYIAVAIGIHNIPEGLAVAIPLRAAGASINKCFWAAFLTSLPQPLAAVPASLASWFFNPIMTILMGFAAGAMIFLILLELIPEALESETSVKIAWFFTIGFCMMLLIQVVL